MDEKDIEYLQSLFQNPFVGARGVNAVYEKVKKQGKIYNNKTRTGVTLAKIEEWHESREKVQTTKREQAVTVLHQNDPNNNFKYI